MPTLTLSELWIYPIKSAAGVRLERAELDGHGLRHDRRWMVVDEDGDFISQRVEPRLALVDVALEGVGVGREGAMTLSAPGMEPLGLPSEPARTGGSAPVRSAAPRPVDSRSGGEGEVGRVTIWGSEMPARDAGDEAARWLSDFLGRECRLVRMPGADVGPAEDDESGRPRRFHAGRPLAFVDACPVSVIGRASLDELNRRLDDPVPMDRFRPNLVVDGGEPHEEDGWGAVRVGEIEIDLVKPCARCSVTTVDQARGVRGEEPLRTLATYRRREDGKVLFGQNGVHRTRGVLRVGDEVVPVEGE